jgi:hypothetical protein
VHFLEDETVIADIWAKEGFLRVVEAIDVVFSPYGKPKFDLILRAQHNFTASVLETREGRRRNGEELV